MIIWDLAIKHKKRVVNMIKTKLRRLIAYTKSITKFLLSREFAHIRLSTSSRLNWNHWDTYTKKPILQLEPIKIKLTKRMSYISSKVTSYIKDGNHERY